MRCVLTSLHGKLTLTGKKEAVYICIYLVPVPGIYRTAAGTFCYSLWLLFSCMTSRALYRMYYSILNYTRYGELLLYQT